MKKKISFLVKLQKPVCRTPIKPVQKHKSDVKFSRKITKNEILSQIYDGAH
jgi:hypothetical protein